MILLLLGLLLMAATASFIGLAIAGSTGGGPTYHPDLLGNHPFGISSLGAFASGLALATIFGLGLWTMLGGLAFARHHSKKKHAARHERRQLAGQRNAMANRLDESERGGGTEDTTGAVGGEGTRAGATTYRPERRRSAMAFHRPHLGRGH
jgi:hypothetical protein